MKIDTRVNIMIIKENINDIDNLIDLLYNMGIRRISLTIPFPVRKHDYILENPVIVKQIHHVSERYKDLDIIPVRIKVLPTQKYLEDCKAGCGLFYISPDGYLSGCSIHPENYKLCLVDANSNDIQRYFENIALSYLKFKIKMIRKLCRSCPKMSLCGYGCPAVYKIGWQRYKRPDIFCLDGKF